MFVRIASILLMATALSSLASPRTQRLTRAELANRFSNLKDGLSKDQVISLLGRPDDIWNEAELSALGRRELFAFAYGTNGHLSFPTQGTVFFDENGTTSTYRDLKIPPIDPTLLSEDQIERYLTLLDSGCTTDPAVFSEDPLPVIRIVNRLIPLGKRKALALVREYLRVVPSQSRHSSIYNSLRCLFYFPDGFGNSRWSDIGYGPSTVLPDPRSGQAVQQDPLLLVQGIPFSLASDPWGFGGRILDFTDICEKYGTMRTDILWPPDNPFTAYDRLLASDDFLQLHGYGFDGYQEEAFDRVRFLLQTAGFSLFNGDQGRPEVDEVKAAVSLADVRWDPINLRYVRADGSYSEPRSEIQSLTWSIPSLEKHDFRVLFSFSDLEVIVSARWTDVEGDDISNGKLLLYGGSDGDTLLATLSLKPRNGDGTVNSNRDNGYLSWSETTYADHRSAKRESFYYAFRPKPEYVRAVLQLGSLQESSPPFQIGTPN